MLRRKKLLIALAFTLFVAVVVVIYVLEKAEFEVGKAKTRAQLNQYSLALQQFRQVYGHYPDIFQDETPVNLGEPGMSRLFMESLTARNLEGKLVNTGGNRKQVAFLTITKNEYTIGKDGEPQLIDAYGNPNIVLIVDHDGDGVIRYTQDGEQKERAAKVVAFTLATDDYPAVSFD